MQQASALLSRAAGAALSHARPAGHLPPRRGRSGAGRWAAAPTICSAADPTKSGGGDDGVAINRRQEDAASTAHLERVVLPSSKSSGSLAPPAQAPAAADRVSGPHHARSEAWATQLATPVMQLANRSVVYCYGDDKIGSLMRYWDAFTGMPVVDKTSLEVVGVISEKDIFRVYTKLHVRDPMRDPPFDASVESVMTKCPVVIYEEEPLSVAAGLMLTHQIHRLPLVNSEGRLSGIITRRDIMRPLLPSGDETPAGTPVHFDRH